MPAFDYPWLLPAALPLLAAMSVMFRRRAERASAVSFALPGSPVFPRTLRQQFTWLPKAMRAIAILLLVIAAAGPHWGAVRMTDETRGIAIELVVDRSGSMSLTDLDDKSRKASRLDIVKTIAKEFLTGNGSDLTGRSGDALGLISFAAHAQNLSPLVSHNEDKLTGAIDSIEIAHGMEDATAIGDAVALAAARLHATEESSAVAFRSKVIILLTDGQQNWGTTPLQDAAKLAARWNVRVYAIGIRPHSEGRDRDDQISYGLDVLAASTKGMSVMASDRAGLHRFFSTIDRLEPNLIPSTGLAGGFHAAPVILLMALAIICAEFTLRETWLRVVT